ncbi:hypothetical protein BGZ75_005358 [Mortierella antarctica]|nr:hypothetical protein BGZ67_001486 [Mortierella alpina]KAF9989681.1 hypothetical protein BGZ75_005358 [Mortierella antarctica]
MVFCNHSLTAEFRESPLYINGLQEEFMAEHKLDKLEAISGGARMALTRLEGDLLYYKEHFDKLAIDFTEQGTKERFLTFIANELPLNITLESNQKIGKFRIYGSCSQTKAAALKREMEERELNVIQLQREVKEAAEIACRDHDELQNGIFGLKKMLTEMQRKELDLVEMKKVDDQFSGMTLEGAQALLAGQTQQLHSLHQELDDLSAEIEDLKWQESRLKDSSELLALQCHQTEARAKEAINQSAHRSPELEAAYKECLEATRLYQEGVGLESIQYLTDSNTLILKYKITPGSATIHTVNPALAAKAASARSARSRKPVLIQFTILIHPISGRLLSATVESAGCDVRDVIQTAKAKNDIPFLVSETLDLIQKAHP